MRLVILGFGGYGQTVADVATQLNRYEEIIFLDDNASNAMGKCGEYIQYIDLKTEIYPAFGNNELRMKWIYRLLEDGASIPVLIHPTSYVSPTVTMECGNVVLPKAVVNTACHLEKGCIINCGAIIDHGCVIEDGVHVCLGAVVKGNNRIKRCTKIEAGEIKPTIHAVLPIQDAEKAHDILYQGKNVGKVVLTVKE